MMPGQAVNVLLVDDQPNNLMALEAMLEGSGLNLIRAESGVKALKALLDDDFAVILLDVQMPGLDGFETATLIREREKSRHTPIIFVTALSRSDTNVFKGYSLGAVDYLFKPIVPEILRSKVSVSSMLFRNRECGPILRSCDASSQNDLILKAAAEGVLGVDLKGKRTFVNPAAARMTGRSLEEVIGRDVHDISHPKRKEGTPVCDPASCSIQEAFATQALFDCDDELFFREDESSFPVEYCFSPMRDEEGVMTGAVVTFRDVTEKRAAAAATEHERLYREDRQRTGQGDGMATFSRAPHP